MIVKYGVQITIMVILQLHGLIEYVCMLDMCVDLVFMQLDDWIAIFTIFRASRKCKKIWVLPKYDAPFGCTCLR